MRRQILIRATLLLCAFMFTPALVSAATLSLSPASGTHTVGDTFTVEVLLNTEGSGIDGVDINTLNFDTATLKVVDADAGLTGTQIDAGTLLSSTPSNSVDTNSGKITFSQTTGTGSTFLNNSGQVLATITFEAIRSGTTNVTFSFTQDDTTDTNVAADGSDVLTNVVNGRYTIESQSGGTTGGSIGNSSTTGSSGETGTADTDTTGSAETGGTGTSTTTEETADTEEQETDDDATESKVAPFERNLYVGISHPDVKRLQQVLNRIQATRLAASGPGSPGAETEYYGPITADAVKRFQCRHNIVCSGTAASTGYGVTGPKTRGKLNELYADASASQQQTTQLQTTSGPFTAALVNGVSHPQAEILQRYLAADASLYPEKIVSGYYGPLTEAAIQRFQCRHNIVCSGAPSVTGYGRVGPQTRAKLNEVYGGEPIPNVGVFPAQEQTVPPAIQESTQRAQEREAEVEADADTTDATTEPSAAISGGGTLFDRTLVRGDKGEDVKTLQRMLAQDDNVYPEGYITGFFTPATEIAVRKFQEKYGLVSSGTPKTTGYGAVGPTTQEKLIEVFGRP